MKDLLCPHCGHLNHPGTRHCQRCGGFICKKRTLLDEARSWDPRSLAGTGRRDVNFAPLQTFSAPRRQQPPPPFSAAPADPLPNGCWYCPDCGALNGSHSLFCASCGRYR